jgi:hypothetical protein
MAGYFSYFGVKDYTLTDVVQKKVVDLSQYSTIFSKIADDVLFYSYYTMQDGERLDTISQKLYGTPEYYWIIPLINSGITNVFRDLPKDYPTFINYLSKKYPGSAFKLAAGQTIAGKFNLGEIVSFNTTNRARIIGKYPTNGYLQVEVIAGSFPLNSNFTITGASTGHIITVANVIPAYDAPAYYMDLNGNQKKWNATGQLIPTVIRELEADKNTESSQIRVIRPKYIYDVAKQFEAEMKRVTL